MDSGLKARPSTPNSQFPTPNEGLALGVGSWHLGVPADQAGDFAVLEDAAPQRVTVSDLLDVDVSTAPMRGGESSDRLIGILVHRLLQRVGVSTELGDEQIVHAAEAILSAMPVAELTDARGLIVEAVARFRHISSQPDVRELYGLGQALHEVPFTMRVGGRIVRGTIDCLITSGDRVTVLEFKTGRARPEHRDQAEVYRAAAEALFPGVEVDSRLVYTSG